MKADVTIGAALKRYPATLVSAVLVVVGFALQWLVPLIPLLQRDGSAVTGGQWWRVLTSFLVQGQGWGQFAFNLLGLVVVGAAVERARGTGWWLAAALVAQVGASLASIAWDPAIRDSGSSLVVGGLVGILSFTRFTSPAPWALTAAGYRVFFVTYLAGLAIGGPIAGAVTGSVLTGVTGSVLARTRWAPWASAAATALVAASAVVLVLWRDNHGVAVLLGMLVALAGAAARAISGRSAARR